MTTLKERSALTVDDATWEEWYKALDDLTGFMLGMGHADMPDYSAIRDWYEDGATVKDAFAWSAQAWAEDLDGGMLRDILPNWVWEA